MSEQSADDMAQAGGAGRNDGCKATAAGAGGGSGLRAACKLLRGVADGPMTLLLMSRLPVPPCVGRPASAGGLASKRIKLNTLCLLAALQFDWSKPSKPSTSY